MPFEDILSIALTIIASLGGGGAIVFGLSTWLGKLWADRLMQRERQKHDIELEHLRSELKSSTNQQLATMQTQLDIAKAAHVQDHMDRMTIYRHAVDIFVGIVAKIQRMLQQKRNTLNADELYEFEVQRMQLYAYLAMHAPQSVMNTHDALSDLILDVVHDGKTTTWEHFRGLAIHFLNEVRKDIGIRPEPIDYRGRR